MADVTYEIDSDGVAVVTWDLENRSMNVLNFQSLGEYRSIIEKLISDESVKGIVLRSAKDAFIAGADLTSSEVFGFDSVQEDKVKASYVRSLIKHVWPFLEKRQVVPIIQKCFGLSKVSFAHKALEKGDHVGKFVLKI